MARRNFIIGDIHGWADKLADLLRRSELVDTNLNWAAGDSRLIFAGDYVDRGPDGIGVIDLIMRLQAQAAEAGGEVIELSGNHDVLILSAHFFGRAPAKGPMGNFYDDWLENGGVETDMTQLTAAHIDWLLNLPAMVSVGDTLILHADAAFYMSYGDSIDAVNDAIRELLSWRDADAWDDLLDDYSEHRTFFKDGETLDEFLTQYGKRRLVHGHSPAYKMARVEPEAMTQAFVYAGKRCINVDPCLYDGGPGFVYELQGEG